MILAADIGATKVRMAAFQIEGDELELRHVERYLTCDHSGFLSILSSFLRLFSGEVIEAVSIGAAGVVENGEIGLTNLNWTISIDQIKQIIKTENIFLLNDVEAQGYGLSTLTDEKVITLQRGRRRPGNKAFMAVGSGLGESILLHSAGKYHPFATEGGHCDFGPQTSEEERLLSFLRSRYSGHVSWERVVSGKFGFRNLVDFLENEGHIQANDPILQKIGNNSDIGKDVHEAAKSGNIIATKIMQWFASLLGAEAGNLALKAMSVEGIYLGGGVVRRNADFIASTGHFISSFNDKGRMAPHLQDMPVYLVLDQNLAMSGLANYAFDQISKTNFP